MTSMRSIGREIGTAFAVLAIYLLTVLTPLHHAAATERAFEQLGYSASGTGWVLCTSADPTGGETDVTVAKCPAAGVGKAELVLPALDALPVIHATTSMLLRPAIAPALHGSVATPPSGSRAPPVLT